jgi:hypothetical protein
MSTPNERDEETHARSDTGAMLDMRENAELTLYSHFKRVIGYARPSDYAVGGLAALSGPGLMYAVEKFAPSHAGRGAFPKIMRLAGAIGLTGGFLIFYQRSIRTSNPSAALAMAFALHLRGNMFLLVGMIT